MSVVIMTRFEVDPAAIQDLTGKHADTMRRIAEIAKSNGAIHHQFIQDPDGPLIALDEWEDEEAFHRFFDQQDDIKAIMAEARLTAPPATTTYREVEVPDRF